MNITITFRQMPASAALTAHVQEKVAKLQRFLRQPMSAKVTLSLDRLMHVAEVRLSSGGQHLEAREANDDMYTSVDKVIDKLERQIRGKKGSRTAKARRGGETLRGRPDGGAAVSTEDGDELHEVSVSIQTDEKEGRPAAVGSRAKGSRPQALRGRR